MIFYKHFQPKIFIMAVDSSGIQMKRKELTKTYILIFKKTNLFVFMVYTNIFQRWKGSRKEFKVKRAFLQLLF